MEQIPDAPYIREAENDGWGPEDDGLDDAIEYLEDADESIDTAMTRLEEAEAEFSDHGEDIDMADLIVKLTSIGLEIRRIKRNYRL